MIPILLVDDDPDMLDLMQLAFKDTGNFDVTACLDARDAVEVLKQRPIAVVISDYRMPVMNGGVALTASHLSLLDQREHLSRRLARRPQRPQPRQAPRPRRWAADRRQAGPCERPEFGQRETGRPARSCAPRYRASPSRRLRPSPLRRRPPDRFANAVCSSMPTTVTSGGSMARNTSKR